MTQFHSFLSLRNIHLKLKSLKQSLTKDFLGNFGSKMKLELAQDSIIFNHLTKHEYFRDSTAEISTCLRTTVPEPKAGIP